jgi:hypothetical protein
MISHIDTETFCIVATQPGEHGQGHFIYATAPTKIGATTSATALTMGGTPNKQGYLRGCQNVRIVKLDTPTFRTPDTLTDAERETALEVARLP